MRRKKTQHISELLNQFRSESPYEQKLKETQLLAMWPQLLGPTVANATRNLYVQNKTLFVHIDSSVMRHELFMMRSQILQAFVKQIGPNIVNNIVFR